MVYEHFFVDSKPVNGIELLSSDQVGQRRAGEAGITPLMPIHEVHRLWIDKEVFIYPLGGTMRLIIGLVSVKATI